MNTKSKKAKPIADKKISRLAILAGSGNLPLAAAQEAHEQNVDFLLYASDKKISENFKEKLPEDFHNKIRIFSLTKVGALLKMLKKDNVSHLLMTGKVQKNILLNPFDYDLKTIRLLATLKNRNDDEIFRVLLQTFEENNLTVLPQSTFLQKLLWQKGVYSKKKPTKAQWQDIRFGLYYAQQIGALDIGQTVVVTGKMILAVESAVEGTDETILRGGRLAKKHAPVVCKAEKKNQDKRFDVPAIGINTLQAMHKSGCKVLAFEAGTTLVAEAEKIKSFADEHAIVLVSEPVPANLDV